MARSIWSGYISFGLVAIPVTIYPVENKDNLHFHLLDSRDKSRIKYDRVNAETGKEVPWDSVVKAYEFDENNYVIVDEEAFQKASKNAFKSIEIEEFIDLDKIDTLYFDKPYYLLPDSKNNKAYVLLREALQRTHKAGVAKAVIRSREHLTLIFPHENALVLYFIRFSENMREEEALNFPNQDLKTYRISEQEIKMAISLIENMSAEWEPQKYHDEYKEKLLKWIEEKIPAEPDDNVKKSQRNARRQEVVDFMQLLKNSMKKKSKQKPEKAAKSRTK